MGSETEAILVAIEGVNTRVGEVKEEVMLYRKETREDTKELWTEIGNIKADQSAIKVRAEKNKGRLIGLEKNGKQLVRNQQGLIKHVQNHEIDNKMHYNPELAKEGISARLWRKKLELTIIVFLITFISTLGPVTIDYIVKAMNGGP